MSEGGYTATKLSRSSGPTPALADLPLPKPPESLEKQLRIVLDHESQSAHIRARVAADLLVALREWFDEFVAKANEIGVINDLSVDELLHVAQRSSELRAAGHQ